MEKCKGVLVTVLIVVVISSILYTSPSLLNVHFKAFAQTDCATNSNDPSCAIPFIVTIGFKVNNPRTHTNLVLGEVDGTDTDFVSGSATFDVGNEPPINASNRVGDVSRGNIIPDALQIGPIYVTPKNNLTFDYLIENDGKPGGSEGEIQKELNHGSDVTANYINGIYPQYEDLTNALNDFNHWLDDALGGGVCDGTIAVDKITLSPADLDSIIANGAKTATTNYPGFDSRFGCGSNSNYDVTWTVSIQGNPPPNGGSTFMETGETVHLPAILDPCKGLTTDAELQRCMNTGGSHFNR